VTGTQGNRYNKNASVCQSLRRADTPTQRRLFSMNEKKRILFEKQAGHLSVMVNAGVLSYRKEGLKVFYCLKTPCIVDFFACVTRVLKQQAREHEQLLASL